MTMNDIDKKQELLNAIRPKPRPTYGGIAINLANRGGGSSPSITNYVKTIGKETTTANLIRIVGTQVINGVELDYRITDIPNSSYVTLRELSLNGVDVSPVDKKANINATTHVELNGNTEQVDEDGCIDLTTLLSSKADLVNGKVPASQLPSYVDDVVEFATLNDFPAQGESGKLYLALDTNIVYRWTGSTYASLNDVDFSNYYTKAQVDAKESAINTRIGNLGSDITGVQSDVGRLDTKVTNLENSIPSSYVKSITDNNVDRIISYTDQSSTANTIDYKAIKHESSYSANNISKYWITEVYNASLDNGLWYKDNSGNNKRIATRDDLSNYQLATTTGLDTNSSTIVGAINEVNAKANQSIATKSSTLAATWDYSVVRSQGMIFSGEFLTPQIISFDIEVDLYQASFTANVAKDIATSMKYTPYNGGTQQAMNDWVGSCVLYHGSNTTYGGTYHINGAATLKLIFNSTFTTTNGDVLILYGIKPRL